MRNLIDSTFGELAHRVTGSAHEAARIMSHIDNSRINFECYNPLIDLVSENCFSLPQVRRKPTGRIRILFTLLIVIIYFMFFFSFRTNGRCTGCIRWWLSAARAIHLSRFARHFSPLALVLPITRARKTSSNLHSYEIFFAILLIPFSISLLSFLYILLLVIYY